MARKANETDQLTLLERDIKIQFDELRKLRSQIDILREENEQLRERLAGEEQNEKDELAYYIRNQREARKMSFTQFARLTGTSTTSLQSYEKGKGKLDNMKELVNDIRKLRGGLDE